MVIANHITLTATPGNAKPLRALLNELAAHAATLKGCHKFELYQFEEARERFMIIEIFKSGKARKAYLENETTEALFQKIRSLSVEEKTEPLKLTQCLTKQRYWREE